MSHATLQTRCLPLWVLAVVLAIAGRAFAGPQSCHTERILGTPGLPVYAAGTARQPDVSADGRFVAFLSDSTELVSPDVNGGEDVFVYDRQTGLVSLESILPSGQQGSEVRRPSLSADGSLLVFSASGPGFTNQVFLRNRLTSSTSLVSANTSGAPSLQGGFDPRISADGAVIIYRSGAFDIVTPSPTDGFVHLCRFNVGAGTTTLVDLSPAGSPGNGSCFGRASLSTDGQRVVFMTRATNLGPVDSNSVEDVYVRDVAQGTTTLVAITTPIVNTNYMPSISADGVLVAVQGGPGLPLHIYNLTTGSIAQSVFTNGQPASITADGSTAFVSGHPAFRQSLAPPATVSISLDLIGLPKSGLEVSASADGTVAAFVSDGSAAGFVPAQLQVAQSVYVWSSGAPTASVMALPNQVRSDTQGIDHSSRNKAPLLSGNGRYVLFDSAANNLVGNDMNLFGTHDAFVADLQTGSIRRIPTGNGVNCTAHDLSFDGRFCVVTRSGVPQPLAVYDLTSMTAVREASGGRGSISDDGRYLSVDRSLASGGGTSVELYDLLAGTSPTPVVLATGGQDVGAFGDGCRISGNGRYVVYRSDSSALVLGDTNGWSDIFIFDRFTQSVARVSLGAGSVQATKDCLRPSVSADGRFVCFESEASNLVAGDTNSANDIFVRDRMLNTTIRATVSDVLAEADQYSGGGELSDDGRYVTFWSYANNLVPGDLNRWADVFVRDTSLGVTRMASLRTDCTVGDGVSWYPSQLVGGRLVAFSSFASTLVDGDTNGFCDVFVRECDTSSQCGAPVGQAFCSGDGSATPCPCGNTGLPGQGCDNSLLTGGGLITASGTASIGLDTLTLHADGVPTTSFVLFIQAVAQVNGGLGTVLGDGLSCAGGTLIRLGSRNAVNGVSGWGYGVPATGVISIRGNITVGCHGIPSALP